MPHQILFEILFWSAMLFAWVRGGGTERMTAALFFFGCTAPLLVAAGLNVRFRQMEWGLLTIDAIVFAGLLALWIKTSRIWLIAMTSMQLVDLALHVARALMPDIGLWAYQRASAFWGYPMLLLLIVATYRRDRPQMDAASSSKFFSHGAHSGQRNRRRA